MTRRTLSCQAIVVAACVALIAPSLYATPTVGSNTTWTAVGDLLTWTIDDGANTGLEAPGGHLNIEFEAHGAPPQPHEDTFYSSANQYTGSYQQADLAVRFSFRATNELPAVGGFKFYLQAASGREWEYAFTQNSLDTWQSHDVGFTFVYAGQQWEGGSGLEADFLADLANVTRVGLYLKRQANTTDAIYFDLDDWEYAVPEPGALFMFGAMVLSFGATFRRKFRYLFGPEEQLA